MTHTKANKSKILALILCLTLCLALMLGIAMASSTFAVYAEGGTGTTGGLIIDGTGNITAPDATYAYSAADNENVVIFAHRFPPVIYLTILYFPIFSMSMPA